MEQATLGGCVPTWVLWLRTAALPSILISQARPPPIFRLVPNTLAVVPLPSEQSFCAKGPHA